MDINNEKENEIEFNLIDKNDCIIQEIRKHSEFERIFKLLSEFNEFITENRKGEIEIEDRENYEIISTKTEELYRIQISLENAIHKKINKIDNFQYEVNGVGIKKADLSMRDVQPDEYGAHRDKMKNTKKEIKYMKKDGRALKLAKMFSFDTSGRLLIESKKYGIDCLMAARQKELEEEIAFVRKYNFINSLSREEYDNLVKFMEKSEEVGNAIKSLEENGKERQELEKKGRSSITIAAVKKCIEASMIEQSDYDKLIEFIAEVEDKIKKDYKFKDVKKDESELGNMIYEFLDDLEKNKKIEKMFEEFNKANLVEDNRETEQIVINKENIMLEELGKTEKKSEENQEDIIDKKIATSVLKNKKIEEIIKKIKEEQEDIKSEENIEIGSKLTSLIREKRNLSNSIEKDKAELTKILRIEVDKEDGKCYFGELVITKQDIESISVTEEEYERQLDSLDDIKKAEKNVRKEIKRTQLKKNMNFENECSTNLRLYEMNMREDMINEEKTKTERRIKVIEFLAEYPKHENKIKMFINEVDMQERDREEIEQLSKRKEDMGTEEYRKSSMKKALNACLRDGRISKEEHNELFESIVEAKKEILANQNNYSSKDEVDYIDQANNDDIDEADDIDLKLIIWDYMNIDGIKERLAKKMAEEANKDSNNKENNDEDIDSEDIDDDMDR